MKSFGLLQKMILWGTLVIPLAYGQLGTPINVSVPFDFHVGKNEYPAGEYRVSTRVSGSAILLQSKDLRRSQFVLTQAVQAGKSKEQPSLVFNRYGNAYFLSTVWLGSSDTGRWLAPGREQTELARQLPIPVGETVVQALGKVKR
jgi:hypothetical protein